MKALYGVDMEHATSKSRLNTEDYNKNTIDDQTLGVNNSMVFSLCLMAVKNISAFLADDFELSQGQNAKEADADSFSNYMNLELHFFFFYICF